MAQIFISYAREDFQHAKSLYEKLAREGFRPWMDKVDLVAGQQWQPAIERAIQNSDFFLLLLSSRSVRKRGFVQREIRAALDLWQDKLTEDVYLIPVMLESLPWAEVPAEISKFQWVEFYESAGWEDLVKALEYGVTQRGVKPAQPVPPAKSPIAKAPEPPPIIVRYQRHDDETPMPESTRPSSKPPSQRLTENDMPKRPPRRSSVLDSSELVSPAPMRARWPLVLFGILLMAGVIYLANSGQRPQQFDPAPTPRPTDASSAMQPKISTFTENFKDVKVEMVRLPGGSYLMGSPDSEPGRDTDEGPLHQVTVPSFSIGKYEITQAQWQAVMGKNPSYFKGKNLPVESVSWNDAKDFCKRLSQLTGQEYRLPSEAEWEYACRANTTSPYAGELETMAWYGNNSGTQRIDSLAIWKEVGEDNNKYWARLKKNGNQTHPVGQKQANAFGLFDTHGNVWEWCEDVYHDSYGGKHGNPPTDGSAWLSGGDLSFRVLRGGSFDGYEVDARSAIRFRYAPGDRLINVGLRVALSARTP
jgi:formylglycine-generating enzyme required for sulfatase activity